MAKGVVAAILTCAVMVLVAVVPLALAGTHFVPKGDQGPRASAVTWEFTPTNYGIWAGHIVNDGLRSLVVDVCDITTGVPEEIMHQRIRFAACGAYPTGVVDTEGVVVAAGHKYQITVTPSGPRGSSCTVDDPWQGTPPVAVFTAVVSNLAVFVDGSASYDVDGVVVTCTWDFGDGTTGTGVTALHTYAFQGIYMITLTVTDNDGYTGSANELIWWYPPVPPPVALFTWSANWMSVVVNGSASYDADGPIVSYAWDFGDGDTATGMIASHTYTIEGTYAITLTVTDMDGLTGSVSHQVTISPPPV